MCIHTQKLTHLEEQALKLIAHPQRADAFQAKLFNSKLISQTDSQEHHE